MKIKLIVLDVDGVLTDGSILITEKGEELKSFFVKDGFAIKRALEKGIDVAVISGRKSRAVEIRCKELGISSVFQGISDKLEVLKHLCLQKNIKLSEVAGMGDDIPDIPLLSAIGFSGAPSDAVEEVKKIVNFVSKYPGGKGAVREFIDYILRFKS
jgi:3-deoxy-D-manno-octulosonate 8-phosphate phosphatase (KDO 8-P phosphatase)